MLSTITKEGVAQITNQQNNMATIYFSEDLVTEALKLENARENMRTTNKNELHNFNKKGPSATFKDLDDEAMHITKPLQMFIQHFHFIKKNPPCYTTPKHDVANMLFYQL